MYKYVKSDKVFIAHCYNILFHHLQQQPTKIPTRASSDRSNISHRSFITSSTEILFLKRLRDLAARKQQTAGKQKTITTFFNPV